MNCCQNNLTTETENKNIFGKSYTLEKAKLESIKELKLKRTF